MQPDLPITIRKSLVGLVLILIVGFGLTAALALATLLTLPTNRYFATLLFVGAGVALLGTFVQAYVYSLSRIRISRTELDIINWSSLLASDIAVCEWRQVQDIDVRKGGLLALLFDYGTLLVQTAGTERHLKISYIPQVERVRDVIEQLANEAVTPVRAS